MTVSATRRANANARKVGRWARQYSHYVAHEAPFDAWSAQKFSRAVDVVGEVNWPFAAELLNRLARRTAATRRSA
jgi:hypothetical protein